MNELNQPQSRYTPDPTIQTNLKTRLLNGVNLLANTVKLTLGAKGKTVVFNNMHDAVNISKDGATVAKYIHSPDPYEEMGIKIVRESSTNTMVSSGDGTTSTVILAQAIINKGYELIKSKKISYYEFAKQLDKALEDIIEEIENMSIDVEGEAIAKLKNVAIISSNSEELGSLIYHDVIEQISIYGDIEVVENRSINDVSIETVNGLRTWKGWFSPSFCNNKASNTFEQYDNFILLYDGLLKDRNVVERFIVLANEKQKGLVIFVDDVAPTLLRDLERFRTMSNIPFVIVEHDGMGDNRIELMNDISILTSATIIDSKTILSDSNYEQYLGECEYVKVTDRHTSIVGGKCDQELLEQQIEYVKELLEEDALTPHQRKFNKKRLGALMGGMAIISVGGQTEVEMKEVKDRIEDAVLAVQSAIRKGIVIGGGYTWMKIYHKLANKNKESVGYQTAISSLCSILTQLLINADESYKELEIITNMLSEEPKAYNLKTQTLHSLDEYDVYDASSVLQDAITNAVAVSKSLLSIEAAIMDGHVLA